MSEIKLSELRPAGSELLQDSESFLTELSDRELENVAGGHDSRSDHSKLITVIVPTVKVGPVTVILPVPTIHHSKH